MTKGTFFLLFSAIGIFSVILFDEVSNNNLSNIFRLIIVLHFVIIIFWIAGAFIQALHIPALWSLFSGSFYPSVTYTCFMEFIYILYRNSGLEIYKYCYGWHAWINDYNLFNFRDYGFNNLVLVAKTTK